MTPGIPAGDCLQYQLIIVKRLYCRHIQCNSGCKQFASFLYYLFGYSRKPFIARPLIEAFADMF